MKKTKILLLDGQNINTLALARELGREGYHIGVTCFKFRALTFFSKYTDVKYKVPGYQNQRRYVKEIVEIAQNNNYKLIIPVGLESYKAFSDNRDLVPGSIKVTLPPRESMDIASSKDRTFYHASINGINIPQTIKVELPHKNKLIRFINKVGFPVVLKGSLCGVDNLRYCNNTLELVEALDWLFRFENVIVCQEYIKGETHGFYTYYYEGRMYASFMHERIKEFPITGGPSAVARSYYDKNLELISKKLLDSLDWNGPAMVEWKLDSRDGKYKLIEINPKLWGSLDLTVQSGVNIPKLMVKTMLNEEVEPILQYRDVVFSWTFPSEALHIIATVFSRVGRFEGYESKNNIFGDDLLPTVVQIGHFIVRFITLLIKGELRYPSGKPTIT